SGRGEHRRCEGLGYPEPTNRPSRLMQRKLTAILSADVVAYSSLMERDESGTMERLKVNRNRIFDPQIAIHGGRVFKLIGDGALAEFPSVIAAVECALAIQEATEKAASDATD